MTLNYDVEVQYILIFFFQVQLFKEPVTSLMSLRSHDTAWPLHSTGRIRTYHVPLVLLALKLSQDDYHSPRLPRQLTVLILTSKDDHV
jgi:hypothetical protein